MNSGFDLLKSEFFYHAIDKALEESCGKGDGREPCYTAALTQELPKILNKKMDDEKIRTGLAPKFRIGSCYVHQKPYVKFGSEFKLRCELGDLLVIVKRTINGVAAFNSALFQLKKIEGKDMFRVPVSGGEDKQLTLYTKWGRLKIDLKSEQGTVYDIMPHAVLQGGSYMFIRPDQTPKFVVAVPNREMRALPPSLGVYLSNMVEWRCGRTISPKDDIKQKCADDWSRLIWKVIDLLQGVVSKCKGYGNGTVTRDNGCASLAFLRGCHEIESIGELENGDSDPVGSFGVLYIEEIEDVSDDNGIGLGA